MTVFFYVRCFILIIVFHAKFLDKLPMYVTIYGYCGRHCMHIRQNYQKNKLRVVRSKCLLCLVYCL